MKTCKDCYHYKACKQYVVLDYEDCSECEYFKDKSKIIELPVSIGTHLWKITYPYRQEPKVTEFVVKNILTVGKKHKIMLEVQAVNVPMKNIMHISSFKMTKEEAKKALEEMKNE